MSASKIASCRFRRMKNCLLADFVAVNSNLLPIFLRDGNRKNIDFIGFVALVAVVDDKFSISMKKIININIYKE